MSSFLRRLNQFGFTRIRDRTDPTNLDIFHRPNFVSSSVLIKQSQLQHQEKEQKKKAREQEQSSQQQQDVV